MITASERKLSGKKPHDPKVKRELIDRKFIFKRRGNQGQVVRSAYWVDLICFQK